MTPGKEKLIEDLTILEEMTDELKHYLSSPGLYDKKIDHNLMVITVGNYLMRRHRLFVLRDTLLDDAQRRRLDSALEKFEEIRRIHTIDIERKAEQELDSRVQQWERALRELFDDVPSMAFYKNDVEKRAMITALVDLLERSAIKPEVLGKLERLDQRLKQHWTDGSFIWPDAWQAAYPKDKYWWLYGTL